jgi:hypothetical protein
MVSSWHGIIMAWYHGMASWPGTMAWHHGMGSIKDKASTQDMMVNQVVYMKEWATSRYVFLLCGVPSTFM